MKVESRTREATGGWEGLSRFLPPGVSLFAAGLSGFLLILIGLPVLMVILMSLRTGFPGEAVPYTLENFTTVYSTPRTYEILLNTIFFAISSVSITLLITVPLVWILMRTDIPFKKTIYVLLTIGILIPDSAVEDLAAAEAVSAVAGAVSAAAEPRAAGNGERGKFFHRGGAGPHSAVGPRR